MYDTIIIGNHLQFDHVKESLVYWFVLLMKRTSHPNASELDAKHWLALGYNQILFIGFARAGWYRLIPKYSKHSKYSKKKWKKNGGLCLKLFMQAQGKAIHEFVATHQDRSKNALLKSLDAAYLAWTEELRADQTQFVSDQILPLGFF